MRVQPGNLQVRSDAEGHRDSLTHWLKASAAYTDAINALHALAARRDGDHYAELYKQAKQAIRDAQALQQRAERHLRQIARGMKGSNDAD